MMSLILLLLVSQPAQASCIKEMMAKPVCATAKGAKKICQGNPGAKSRRLFKGCVVDSRANGIPDNMLFVLCNAGGTITSEPDFGHCQASVSADAGPRVSKNKKAKKAKPTNTQRQNPDVSLEPAGLY